VSKRSNQGNGPLRSPQVGACLVDAPLPGLRRFRGGDGGGQAHLVRVAETFESPEQVRLCREGGVQPGWYVNAAGFQVQLDVDIELVATGDSGGAPYACADADYGPPAHQCDARGTPLSGIPGPLAAVHRQWLAELWLDANESWAEVRLQLGAEDGLIAALTRLSSEHPFRERLVSLLMSALYRAGRATDALAAYRELGQPREIRHAAEMASPPFMTRPLIGRRGGRRRDLRRLLPHHGDNWPREDREHRPRRLRHHITERPGTTAKVEDLGRQMEALPHLPHLGRRHEPAADIDDHSAR
jgi:hypothetical protein